MKHRSVIKNTTALYSISIIAFFSALHSSITTYFNSSFLATFASEKTISLIYLIISLVTIVGLLGMQSVLQRLGNFRTAIALILIQILVFFGLITYTNPSLLIILFILGMSIISLIAFTIDIFLQKSTDIGHTGTIRGSYMTAINFAWILGPFLGGMLIVDNDYRGIYIAAFALLFPLLYVVYKNFSTFKDSHYVTLSARQTFIRILKDKDISRIFTINIVLQTFYAWMTVYTPIYLHNTLGFNWGEISIIFTIMLLPFIFVEIPLGKLADKKWGEKEMMIIGFVIMGIATAALTLFCVKSIIAWAIMLFITRIGAATAEVMIETYFFVKVDGRDPEVLGLFRITRPLSYFTAPLIVTIGLVYTTDRYLFLIFGALCLLMVYPISKIRDTK